MQIAKAASFDCDSVLQNHEPPAAESRPSAQTSPNELKLKRNVCTPRDPVAGAAHAALATTASSPSPFAARSAGRRFSSFSSVCPSAASVAGVYAHVGRAVLKSRFMCSRVGVVRAVGYAPRSPATDTCMPPAHLTPYTSLKAPVDNRSCFNHSRVVTKTNNLSVRR
ncbi:hypothetical protein EVAR_2218_1 [Eumeta japonica]|uniref:Uncharacterized protein n=1 Tax=Eumeta variegata TaxID=151549 RepID=A0A4C1SI59_EUMVA|nr:hypothetical protein EVAR_2218_1 [Eumeta japonica]